MEKSQFGDMVRRAREAKGLKAFELADLMHTHGSAISRLENGTFKETPSVDLMNQLHEHLGLTHREMLSALGYAVDADESGERRPDAEIIATLHRAIASMPDWRATARLDESILGIIESFRSDRTPRTVTEPLPRPLQGSESSRR